MKGELLKITKICEELLSPYDFKRKEETFWRVVNDVCQKISIETISLYARHWRCRVNFGIYPLCQGLTERNILFPNEPYSLDLFDRKDISEMNKWIYTSAKEDRMECAQKVRFMVTEYLIPFFMKAISCETAWVEIQSLESAICNNPSIFELNKCYMAMKTGQWEVALRITEFFVESNSAKYKRKLAEYMKNHSTLPNQKGIECLVRHLQNSEYDKINQLCLDNAPLQARVQEAHVIKIKMTLDKFAELRDRIKQQDYAFFDALFAENEELSRTTFSNLPNSTFSWRKFRHTRGGGVR